ncbi:hypothetical protein Tco_0890273 [Tanacetum coccineum]|uniref:Uncharacterized protein n=1 Tax=Tanacetum coccineum TaxID=301880 RepID=A0ABQ5C002_9ASTR
MVLWRPLIRSFPMHIDVLPYRGIVDVQLILVLSGGQYSHRSRPYRTTSMGRVRCDLRGINSSSSSARSIILVRTYNHQHIDADSSTPQNVFIDHLLGLHDVVRHLDVGGHFARDVGLEIHKTFPPEDRGEEHMELTLREDVGMGFEIVTSDVREDDEEFETKASATDMREIVVDPLAIGDSSESSRGGIPDLEDTIYDIVHYMSEVRIDRITEIETTQRQLETRGVSLGDYRRLESYVDRHLARDQSHNGIDGDKGNGSNEDVSKNEMCENGNCGNGISHKNGRGDRPLQEKCTYQDFMKSSTTNIKGTEGVCRIE